MRRQHRRHQPDHPGRYVLHDHVDHAEKADFNAVQEKLEGVATELGVQITIQREDVFQFMYKI